MLHGCLFSYFGGVAIINLPERTDRLSKLEAELERVGLDVYGPKVCIPVAPRPIDANGFSSRGVYGNLLSHLSILAKAIAQDLEPVLILEDDAIFNHSFNNMQPTIVQALRENNWDPPLLTCYL
jgi:GR25 family glycosyltransferase involved in LPS biosynthesis